MMTCSGWPPLNAEAALRALQQGRHPVEEYTVDFRKWSADTSWNEAALKYQYRQGLWESLKEDLARVVSRYVGRSHPTCHSI